MPILVVDGGDHMLSVFVNPTDREELVIMLSFEDESREDVFSYIPLKGLKEFLEVLRATR